MNTETTCVEKQPLTDAYLEKMNAYWRAANYLSAAQLYLLDNPLLREPLKPEHIKKKIVGHWGTVPGQNFVYCHMNRAIKKYDLDMVLISGPGHGGNFFVSNSYLEGTYSEVYPNVSEDMDGLKKLCKQFSFPGGISSHVAPETPGSINEGGELGYSIAHAFGSVFDNPDLITTCIVGDGEAETGPLATAWHSNKFLNPVTDGAVLPILHLNGYKISNPTIFSRISHDEIESFFHGCGWKPYFVEGDDPMTMHRKMAETVDTVIEEILGTENPKSVTGLRLKNVKNDSTFELAVDGLFIAVGHHPNTELFKKYLQLDNNGYIVTLPGSSKTNIEGVFAAGDVKDPQFRQAVIAAGSGCIAALEAEKFLNENL